MRITTNVPAMTAHRSLVNSQREIQKSNAQMSSGSRITKSADDAAGLAISETLKSQVRGYSQASRNANDGVSLVQTAEGGMNEVSNIITRLRELGIQASSDTISDVERGFVDKEVQALKEEVQRIAVTTRFGSQSLTDGSGQDFDIQVGINNKDSEDRITYRPSETNVTLANLNLDDLDYTSKEGAQEALSMLDEAHSKVSGYRAGLGALQNRLQSTIDNVAVMQESVSAANSRIRDADVALASSELMRNNILLQAGTSAMAQANQVPALALKLIG